MIYTSAQRYLTPKWQARVIPSSKAFKFSNGVTVNNLWELKQSLRVVREDIINEHILGEVNDIANWVKNEIKDERLASELAKQNNRWGMIIALEREMMRTLNLPANVAQRWLNKTPWAFKFVDGTEADCLTTLRDALEKVSDETVAFHLEREPNDISKWINDITGDYILSEIISEAHNRKQMIAFLQDHLEMLQHSLTCR